MAIVKWGIRPEQELENEAVAQWGADEWERRKAVCEKKKGELEDVDGWEARIIVGGQFESIARVMSQHQWDSFTQSPVGRWRRLVEKLILG